ncbi:MAG TPA: zinc ABC transporter substrate-binding protein [Streptosporangiaceae bacterium]|jgi:zinc/manganese transport system substrate-binding protein
MSLRRATAAAAAVAALSLLAAACSASATTTAHARTGIVVAVGAENEYANVISQIGGRYVRVAAVESNPNTDPHSFEASASVSQTVGAAELVVQNGLGYDSYMTTIEDSAPNPDRKIIDVQHLLRRPDSAPNPHLWYSPATMPAVAKAITADLARLRPVHAAYFRAQLQRFTASLRPWQQAIARFRAAHAGTPVATTEPVGDYLLSALGLRNATPFGLQADIMNGVDLSPQYVTLQNNLLEQRKVAAFVYNQQVVDSVTEAFLAKAKNAGIPVVGVYETMPRGYSYQSWMLAEVHALERAITAKTSTEKL